mmetsp:Transcript_760/g.1353  ORF Transcript_760/g.1353 Transcript_760/m.1353 type:complete len:104 (-) Transcript_760:1068-1379(-)|eukprot:CAMPEP_0116575308 /NCGR_PEP_ID=MMETSP0397-20121206/19884_1 /TAXON_ID=216820 /ORGANISM="Cyclophora tenuis, Strain ECT3854" /LENGTH=103 /DNA_ID=CAMNT_0004104183 /DNA_START=14 /DNA_END=325 /DNA_ORIENTATION=-
MVYIGSDGNLKDRRSPWRFSIITDFLASIYDFVGIFLHTIFNPPQLEGQRTTTYAERNRGRSYRSSGNTLGGGSSGGGRGRGSNIRGMKNINGGTTNAPAGGG